MRWLFFCCFFLIPTIGSGGAVDKMCSTSKWGPSQCIKSKTYAKDVCRLIKEFSARHKLDPHFFARLIWQESRFDPNAVSPVGAQGIAQFMPETAKLRGLKDPFNPAEALEHSAEYLADMSRRYGNVGLAAVGYNGGESRAEGLLAGRTNLPFETVNYVQIITGISHDEWVAKPMPKPDLRLSKTLPFDQACLDLADNKTMVTFQPAKSRRKPWGIQMAFGVTKNRALNKFKKMTRNCKKLVAGEAPELIFRKSRASSKRGYYLARLGRNSVREARKDCAKFRQNGCLCAVYKN